jgi:hypothetical protein
MKATENSVKQWTGRSPSDQEELDQKRTIRNMAMNGITLYLEDCKIDAKFMLSAMFGITNLDYEIDKLADKGIVDTESEA